MALQKQIADLTQQLAMTKQQEAEREAASKRLEAEKEAAAAAAKAGLHHLYRQLLRRRKMMWMMLQRSLLELGSERLQRLGEAEATESKEDEEQEADKAQEADEAARSESSVQRISLFTIKHVCEAIYGMILAVPPGLARASFYQNMYSTKDFHKCYISLCCTVYYSDF